MSSDVSEKTVELRVLDRRDRSARTLELVQVHTPQRQVMYDERNVKLHQM